MPDYNAGDAKLQIIPDASGFARKLKADLRTIQVEYAVKTIADTTKAARQLQQFRDAEGRKDIKLDVEVNTVKARAEIAKLSADLGKLRTAGLLNLGTLAIGSLPAAATAIANVAASIQQLAGAGLVVPGALAGIASSVGTVKLGVAGVADAFKAVSEASSGSAKDIEKANEALSKLAPSAREAVTEASKIKDELTKALQLPVQQNLFDGLGKSARKLVDSDLPVVQRGLTSIATSLNQNAKQLLSSLGSDSSKGFLDRIFGNTADAQGRLTRAIDPIVHAVGTLSAAGSDALPRLADGLGAVADRFDQFITAADQDGRLSTWINDGITGFSHLGETVLNIGKSFTAITQAAGTGGLLQTLDTLSGKLATFLNSDAGQAKLTQFFNEGRDQLDKWLPILGNVAQVFGDIYQASKQWTDALLPALQQITGFLAQHPDLVKNVALAFVAWKSIEGVTSLVTSLGKVSDLLGVGLPGAAKTGAGGISAALAGVTVPAWLAFLVGGGSVAAVGVGLQQAHDQGLSPEVTARYPYLRNPREQAPSAPPPLPPAATNDLPPTVKPTPPSAPGYVPTPGAPGDQLPGAGSGAPSLQWPGGPVPGVPKNPLLAPGFAKGGPTPSGRGNGPTGGWISEVHADEWILPAGARRAIGDQALWALTSGRRFDGGGYVDQYGNPVTPGPAPGGPAPVAPNPTGGGGGGAIDSIIGGITSGIQGPIGNALAIGSSLAQAGINQAQGGGAPGVPSPGEQTQHGVGTLSPPPNPAGQTPTFADRFAKVPGLWGGIASLFSSDPKTALLDWGTQTGSWLGKFTAKTAGAFGTALWQGALDAVGLGGSILSPSNQWFQAGTQFLSGSTQGLSSVFGGDGGSSVSTASQQQQQVSPTRIREAGQKIQRADQKVAQIQQRISELKPDAKDSQRMSLADQLANAQQDAADARTDFATITGGGSASASSYTSPYSSSYTSSSGMARAVPTAVPAARVGGGAAQWRPLVEQIVASRRLGPGWVDPLLRQIQTESGGDPRSFNGHDSNGRGGTQQVMGLFNFLPSTFTGNGGQDIWNPADQINTAITYVQNRYGSSGGVPNWIGVPGRGFAGGGPIRGSGGPKADDIPIWASAGEHMFSAADVDAMGGQDAVTRFRSMLHSGAVRGYADAGPIIVPPNFAAANAVAARQITPPAPSGGFSQVPNANLKQLPTPVAPSVSGPPAGQPTPTPPSQSQAPAQRTPYTPPSFSPIAPAPSNDSLNHNLPAVSKGITSAASAIGQAISTAIGLAAGAAGSSGFAPGAGALGALGPYAAGLTQEGGKIVDDAVNVFSSFLVGNVPGQTPYSGPTGVLRPAQNTPITAQDNSRNYVFNGIDGKNVADSLQLQDRIDQQATLAQWRG